VVFPNFQVHELVMWGGTPILKFSYYSNRREQQ